MSMANTDRGGLIATMGPSLQKKGHEMTGPKHY